MSSLFVYLDTNIVIRLIEYRDQEVKDYLDRVHQRAGVVVSSELTLAEALVMPIKDHDSELIALYETFLTTSEGVVVVPVDRAVLRKTAELRATFGNRTPDAIHVATAIESDCRYFMTADRRIRAPETLTIVEVSDLPDWSKLP